jgi:hypothetical protein
MLSINVFLTVFVFVEISNVAGLKWPFVIAGNACIVPEDRHTFLTCLRLCCTSANNCATDALEAVSRIQYYGKCARRVRCPTVPSRYGERLKEASGSSVPDNCCCGI